jgi:hypothetical protein
MKSLVQAGTLVPWQMVVGGRPPAVQNIAAKGGCGVFLDVKVMSEDFQVSVCDRPQKGS